MLKYEFSFGYESPQEFAYNSSHGTDDESSISLYIEAETEAIALEWGQEVAEAYIKWLFEDASISWKSMRYSFGIEGQTEHISFGDIYVKCGELPDFTQLQDAH